VARKRHFSCVASGDTVAKTSVAAEKARRRVAKTEQKPNEKKSEKTIDKSKRVCYN